MLPPRKVVVARSSAGAFGLAAGLSLLNGTTEWTAAYRGMSAAVVTVFIVPFLYGWLEQSLQIAAAPTDMASGTKPRPATAAATAAEVK